MEDRALHGETEELWRLPTAPIALVALVAGAFLVGSGGTEGAAGATLGRSVEDRPITVVRRGDPRARTRVLVVGSIHGDEPGGLVVARRLMRRPAPSGIRFWVVPTFNPDGLARGTRQNARGVDRNRNFPVRWRAQGARGSTFYSGPRALSEPESRLAARLIRRLRPAVTIWLHQPFSLVDAGSGADPRLVRLYARSAGLPVRAISATLPGIATRWQNRRVAGTSAFVVELAAGRVSPAVASRHVRAIRLVASRAASRA
ncbi:MAG: M14 family zinc carboxypeptidase [Miltoncostaeaceae bacterium]